MDVCIDFVIWGRARPAIAPGAEPYIPEAEMYSKLWAASNPDWTRGHWPPGNPKSAIKVRCSPDDPSLADVFTLIHEAGWLPYYGKERPIELQNTHFQVNLLRTYEMKDYDRAEYLWVNDWATIRLRVLQDGTAHDGLARSVMWVPSAAKTGSNGLV